MLLGKTIFSTNKFCKYILQEEGMWSQMEGLI